jgi:hypothetical protein
MPSRASEAGSGTAEADTLTRNVWWVTGPLTSPERLAKVPPTNVGSAEVENWNSIVLVVAPTAPKLTSTWLNAGLKLVIIAPIPPSIPPTITGAVISGIGVGEYWIMKSVIVGPLGPVRLKVTSVVTNVDPAWLGVANAKLAKSPAAMHRTSDRFFIVAPGN